MTWGALALAVDRAATPLVVAATPTGRSASRGLAMALDLGVAGSLLNILTKSQTGTLTRRLGMTIPALRKGHTVITKQPGTWPLRAWRGEALALAQPSWLSNPDPRTTWCDLIACTLDDAIWYDRAYWRVTRRGNDGFPLSFARVPARDVSDDYNGLTDVGPMVNGLTPREAFPEDPGPVILADGRVLESFISFHWNGLGGMLGAGAVVVDLALSLLSAASNQAQSPMPAMTLVDEGAVKLTDTEIDELLTAWETARQNRSTAYAHRVKPTPNGWSARELQLVEGREHSALEVARALSLPAFAVDAANGASLEYSTTVENRRELVEALRMWTAPLEQTLSLQGTPRGTDVRLDVTSYLRDDPGKRMTTWAAGIACGALTIEEVRAQEPLAFTTGGTP